MESKIQRKIIVWLEQHGWLVNKIINCSKPGWTDVEAFRNKKAVFIEVKDTGKKPDRLQLFRHDQIRAQGFEVIVADKIDDVQHLA